MKTEGSVRISWLDWLTLALVIVGALNWGLVGFGNLMNANWNLVNLIFGGFPTVEAIIYVLVGLAGLYEFVIAYQLYSAARRPSRQRGTTSED